MQSHSMLCSKRFLALLSERACVCCVGAAIATFFQYNNLRYSQQTWLEKRRLNKRERELRNGIGINQMCMKMVCTEIHVTNDWCSYCASFNCTYIFFPHSKRVNCTLENNTHGKQSIKKKKKTRAVCVCVFSHFFKIYIHLFHRLAAGFFFIYQFNHSISSRTPNRSYIWISHASKVTLAVEDLWLLQ